MNQQTAQPEGSLPVKSGPSAYSFTPEEDLVAGPRLQELLGQIGSLSEADLQSEDLLWLVNADVEYVTPEQLDALERHLDPAVPSIAQEGGTETVFADPVLEVPLDTLVASSMLAEPMPSIVEGELALEQEEERKEALPGELEDAVVAPDAFNTVAAFT